MSLIQIPNLPAVIGLDGSELFEGVQAGTSVKISLAQMIAATRAGLPTTLPIPISLGGTGATTAATARTNLGLGTIATQDASNVAITGGFATLTGASSVTANSASAALTVTQTGAGNSFVVEDSTSPDSTPFVVDASGNVGVGVASPSVKLDVSGSAQLRASGAFLLQNSDNTNSYYIQNNGVTGSANPVFDIIQNGVGTRMRIDAIGNVGIGTSAPASKLSVIENNTDNVTVGVWNSSTYGSGNQLSRIQLGKLEGVTYEAMGIIQAAPDSNASSTAGYLAFHTRTANATTERFRFASSGQLGIGGANYGTSGQTIISAGSGAAPAWGAIGVAGGGTGITSYTIGDIVYASGTTTLSKLADVATGNALISGGVGVAPSYGKIGLTTHVSGTLGVGNGGTGQSSNLTQYGIVYGSTTTAMATTPAGTATQVLHGNAAGAPTWSAVSLTADVSGVLPLANGGTNATTGAGAYANLLGYTATATAAGTTVLTNTSTQYQLFTGATTQTITLPVTSTLTTGWTFHIVNNSTGNLTVNSSGGNLVCTVISGMTAMVTCIATATTTAADWEFGFTDFGTITGTGAVVLGTGPTITSGVYSGTVGASSPSTGAFTTVTASTSVLSTGAGGIGYATGAGVAVTQLTSRTTAAPTTGAKTTGAVTLFTTTAVVGTYFSFTVPNTAIAVTDTVVLSVRGATNTYVASVTAITAATSFQITMASVAGTASDTPIVNFTIIKGVSA